MDRCGARPAVPDTRCFHASSPTATEFHERAMGERARLLVVCVYGRVSERPVRSSKACARDVVVGGDLLRILLFLVPLVRRRLSVSLSPTQLSQSSFSPRHRPRRRCRSRKRRAVDMKPAAAPRTPDCKGRAAERRDSGHGRGRLRCCGGTLCARSATMRWRATYPLLPLARCRYRCIFCPWRERSKKTVMHAKPRNQSATALAR